MAVKKDKARSLEQAEKYIRSGKFQDAIGEYERLMEGEALDPNIANVMGDLYLRVGREDKAVKTFQDIAASYESKGLYSQSLAVFKKINKAVPEDVPSAVKLADLYSQLGFSAEAKAVFGQVAERLEKERHLKGLIFVYEKLIKLDRTDIRYRLKLADLYSKDGAFDEAVEQLNDAAEIKIEGQDLAEAEKLLNQARTLRRTHVGTVLNLANIMKKRNKVREAIPLLEEALSGQRDNLELLSALGGMYIDDGNLRLGEEVYSRLFAKYPNDINIRVKLGYTLIQQNKVDTAFHLYEPLINTLLSKGKEEKAIGLLGLIFTADEIYIPALEKLAVIYKSKEQRKNLELALRVLLQEYRRKNLKDRMLIVLRQLVGLCPDDKALAQEYATLGTPQAAPKLVEEKRPVPERKPVEDKKRPDEKKATKSFSKLSEQDQEMIRINLNKADGYLQAGLVRNAHRILENLLLLYPDEPRITQKIALVKESRAPVEGESYAEAEGKAAERGGRAAKKAAEKEKLAKEEKVKEEKAKSAPEPVIKPVPEPVLKPVSEPAKPVVEPARPEPEPVKPAVKAPPLPPSLGDMAQVTAADLFSTVNLIIPPAARKRMKYYDLRERIAEEQALMEATYYQQFKKETAVVEKELADIITEFRRKMEEKVDKDNYEQHYNLGVAFWDQALFDEAIVEFRYASQSPARAVECYTLLCLCYKRKKDFAQAKEWIEKALNTAEPQSDAVFAVKYEWAVLLEDMNERQKAVPLYQEVKSWNSEFRDVTKRLRALNKATA